MSDKPKQNSTSTQPTTNATSSVMLTWDNSRNVIIRIDGKDYTFTGNQSQSLKLRHGQSLELQVKLPGKTYYPDEYLILDEGTGYLTLRISGDVAKFSYESETARRARESQEVAERIRLEEEKRISKQKAQEAEAKQTAAILSGMVKVAGGSFTMGCITEQGDCGENEKPMHRVTIKAFYMSKYEVTVQQFEQFVKATGYKTEDEKDSQSKGINWRHNVEGNPYYGNEKDKFPVIRVSWNDTKEYCRWLSAETGKSYRLPTEAEWEYAARGGNKSSTTQYSGSGYLGSVGWFGDNSGSATHSVGEKQANELGLYDMSGNVWEWCSDWYGDKYYSVSPTDNPQGPSTGIFRVFRGGCWGNAAVHCRVASRYGLTPDYRSNFMGFRLAFSE